MQQYALMGCHLVLRTGSSRPGEIPTMAKVKRALEDETFRRALLAQYPFKYDDIYRFWTEREPEMAESQRTSLSALLRRLDLFLTNPITRAMLSVERPSVDLRAAMDDGGIVLIPMPHRTLGDLAPLVGMLIVQSIVAAAYARKGDALTRVTAPVFIDEVQVFIVDEQSPDLEQAFTQLRGFAVPLIVLHQTMKQLGALEETFRINAANRLILRTGEPDASVYAKMYAQSGLRPEDILAMQALSHQYAVTLGPNREQLVFSLIPNAWPAPQACDVGLHLGPRDWQELTPPADIAWSDGERTTKSGAPFWAPPGRPVAISRRPGNRALAKAYFSCCGSGRLRRTMMSTMTTDTYSQPRAGEPRAASPGGAGVHASEALLHQLCDVLTAIVGGEEPFGPLVIQRPMIAADGAGRDGDQRRKERAHEGAAVKREAPADDPASWPQGPLINNRPLDGESVEQIVTAVLADVRDTSATALGREQLRESMRRLGLDGPTVGRVTPPLLVWLAKAGVLGAADDEGAPWAVPRVLTSTDPEAVRLLLRAVEPPAQAEIELERTRGLR
jgi:hypothetical protein